jgi:hypothetical protein
LQISARPEEPQREINEAERQAMLRGQRESAAGTKRMPAAPSRLQFALMEASKPEAREAGLKKAREVLVGLRGVAMASPSEDQLLELFVAATALAEAETLYGNHEHARAALESVLDLLSKRDLRDRIRLAIARSALMAGDAEEAERWVEAVDPRSTDLAVDTERRLVQALMALREGRHADALDLLGEADGHMAHFIMGRDSAESILDLARAHALVGLGREPEALLALKRSAGLHLRPSSFKRMAALYSGVADGLVPRVAARIGRGFRVAMIIVAIAMLAGLLVPVILALVG